MAYIHILGATRISPLFLLFFNSGQMSCPGFCVCGSEGVDGGWGGGAASRKRGEIWLYLGDKGSNSSSYAKKRKDAQ